MAISRPLGRQGSLALLLALVALTGGQAMESQQHLTTILAARDQAIASLNERLAADRQAGDLLDLVLEAAHLFRHRPLTFELYQRGTRFHGGSARLTSYNHGDHVVDASALRRDGNRIHGEMVVTIHPDQWVPADKQPREQRYLLDLHLVGDQVTGTYQMIGHLGPEKDRVVGTVRPVADTIVVDGPDSGTGDATDLARRCTIAYRQLRAAVLALRDYPTAYSRCLAANRTSLPDWSTGAPPPTELNAYCARLARLAAATDPTGPAPEPSQTGFVQPTDPTFGPYFQATPLAMQEGIAQLPTDSDEDGPQRWQYIPTWSVLGPFPAPHRRDEIVPHLPELVPAPGARYPVATADMPDHFVHPDWLTPGQQRQARDSHGAGAFLESFQRPDLAWISATEEVVRSGRWLYQVLPPRWMVAAVKVPLWGSTKCSWMASAHVHSDRERTIWVEVQAQDAGQLWVDDRLVWHSVPDLVDLRTPKVSVFPITLQPGTTDLRVRVRNDDPQTGMRMLFCTRGAPRATVGAGDAPEADPTAVHHGFRSDGTGRHPAPAAARPPLSWDLGTGTNVRWRVPLPAFSNANPVVVGDVVLTNAEPHWLYCFDKLTGELRWKVASSMAELLPEADRAAAEQAFASIGNTDAPEDPAVVALREQRQAIEQRLHDETDKLDEATQTTLANESAALAEQLAELTGKRSPGRRTLDRHGIEADGWWSFTGFTMATPATDGAFIWVRYGTGAVACYDLQGRRQWLVDSGFRAPIACVSSPVVIGDLVIVEGDVRRRCDRLGIDRQSLADQLGATAKQDLHFVVALDAATGAERWATPVKCGIGGYGSPSGPRAMRLRLENGHVDVVITQRTLLRARDGVVLNDATGTSPGYAGTVIGDVLHAGSDQTRFWAESDDQVGLRHLLRGAGGYGQNGCVLAYDGRYYGNPDSNMRANRTKAPWQDLLVVDADSGALVHRIRPVIEDVGSDYTPPAVCGDYVYLVDTGQGAKSGVGRILVVEAGNQPRPVARTALDAKVYAAPVFDDARMYIRSRASLMCFETTTSAGRELEYARSVDELLRNRARLPLVPQVVSIPDLDPVADLPLPDGVPVVKAYDRTGIDAWLHCGPFPFAEDFVDHLAPLGGVTDLRAAPGMTVGERQFTRLPDRFITSHHGIQEDIYGREYWQSDARIDLTALSEKRGKQVHYFYAVIEVTHPKVLRWQNPGKGYRAWMAGRELADDAVVRVRPGLYPLLLRTQIGRLPPFAVDKPVIARPALIEEDDPLDELAVWRKQVAPFAEHLHEIQRRMPDSPESFEAERYLRMLGEQ